MKNKTLYIGLGVLALGVVGYLLYKKKGGSSDGSLTDAEQKAVNSAKQAPTTSDEAADESQAEDIAAEIDALPDTPEGNKKRKELLNKLKALASRTPLAKIIRLEKAAGKKVLGGIKNIVKKSENQRRCSKEADDKFGFPLAPKKIAQKIEFRKQCKKEGGADFAFGFDSEQHTLLLNQNSF